MTRTAARKAQLGQFFTTDKLVQDVMCALVSHRHGLALEPSAGEGHLAHALTLARPDLTVEAVELDAELSWNAPGVTLTSGDFFTNTAAADDTYDVIFGNPPYVAWKSTDTATRKAAADTKAAYTDKTNLYHMFIDRCVDLLQDNGELVFIVPAEWLYSTSAKPLRSKLLTNGAITDLIHCGEEKLFTDASVPAIMIFRYVKGAAQGPVRFAGALQAWADGHINERVLVSTNDRWLLTSQNLAAAVVGWGRLGDAYDVRVGLVSGCDAAYRLAPGHNIDPSCVSRQVTTRKQLEEFVWCESFDDVKAIPAATLAHLSAHRATLQGRRIAKFNDSNWWKWGAVRNETHMASNVERFFAIAKTRDQSPFFDLPDATHFGGGILGLFRRPGAIDVPTAVAVCNHPVFRQLLEAMFLTTGDKVSFQPATLADVPFPKNAAQAAVLLAATAY